MTDPENPSAEALMRAAEIGKRAGLRYVYAGNSPGMELQETFLGPLSLQPEPENGSKAFWRSELAHEKATAISRAAAADESAYNFFGGLPPDSPAPPLETIAQRSRYEQESEDRYRIAVIWSCGHPHGAPSACSGTPGDR